MSRKTMQIINSDRTIVDLRMQSEDLINNAEHLTEDEFNAEAKRIKNEIDKRMSELIAENENT